MDWHFLETLIIVVVMLIINATKHIYLCYSVPHAFKTLMADFHACVIAKFYVLITSLVIDFSYWLDFAVISVAM